MSQHYRINNPKWYDDLSQGLDGYIAELNENLVEQRAEDIKAEIYAPQSRELYDGCPACIRRETLAYLIPAIIEGYKDGRVMEWPQTIR